MLGLFLCCSFPAQAQRPELRRPQDQQSTQPEPTAKKSKRAARAIGVLEFLPGGGIRLVPVALWWEGKYYDASLYEANPEPLVLQPGTVYQAFNDGEPAGQFVVNMPKLSNAGWIGDGRWTSRRALDAQLAAEAAKQPKVKGKDSKAIFTGGADQGPPVLRRPGSEQSPDQSSQQSSTPAKASDHPPRRKRLHLPRSPHQRRLPRRRMPPPVGLPCADQTTSLPLHRPPQCSPRAVRPSLLMTMIPTALCFTSQARRPLPTLRRNSSRVRSLLTKTTPIAPS